MAQANFRLPKPSLETHEYIAYVVQLATLPVALRQQLLVLFGNPAFQNEREINRIFLQLDPEVFTVKAYRHFIAHPDSQAFFQRLLNSRFSSPRY
nr:DUF6639 family protein [Marinobacter changyiensis]